MLKEEKVLGVKINIDLDYAKTLDYIENTLLKDGKCHYICTTNPEFIMDAQSDPRFKDIINNSDLSVPDGSGVLFALEYNRRISRYSKKSLMFPFIAFFTGLTVGLQGFFRANAFGERIFGVSLAEKICDISSRKNYSVFFLGGWPKDLLGNNIRTNIDLATQAADVMREKYPNIYIIGATSHFGSDEKHDDATIAYIRDSMKKEGVERLDFLLVAFTHLYQEKWILRNSKRIPANVSVGVGGSFDYFAGIKMPSPDIVIQRNLGWLFRFITQPWRLKRIFKAFPLFPFKVFLKSVK